MTWVCLQHILYSPKTTHVSPPQMLTGAAPNCPSHLILVKITAVVHYALDFMLELKCSWRKQIYI